jgi:anti-anti-sigma factor
MAIREKLNGTTTVLIPDANITWRTQPELKDALDGLSASGRKHVIVDLTHVREISGYGLGLLASRCARLRREYGDIRLANACESVRRLLQVTHLVDLFEHFDSADSAARSFTIMDRGEGEDEEDT